MSATHTQGVSTETPPPPKKKKRKENTESLPWSFGSPFLCLSFPLDWQMKSLLCCCEWAIRSFKLIYRQKYSVTHSDYFILTIWASWQNKNQMRKEKTPGSLILWKALKNSNMMNRWKYDISIQTCLQNTISAHFITAIWNKKR